MNILDRIRGSYDDLNRTRRRIADQILSDPARCAFFSIREFADATDSTDVTIIHFCKALGYQSFAEFKKSLQSYVLEWHNAQERMTVIGESSDDPDTFLEKIALAEKEALSYAFELNSASSILKAIALIKQKKRIFVAAHNASKRAAIYLKTRFDYLGINVEILELENIHTAISEVFSLPQEEVLVISITTPPYGKSTLSFTKLVKSKNISVISFVDDPSCPIVKDSDLFYICPALEQFGSVTNSYVSFFAIVDTLSFFYFFNGDENSKSFSDLEIEYREIQNSLN